MNDNDLPFKCSCGRGFAARGPLTYHRRTCSGSQKRLAGVLQNSKDLLSGRKKRRLDVLTAALTVQDTASGHNSMDGESEDMCHLEPDGSLNIEGNDITVDLDAQGAQEVISVPAVRVTLPT